MTSGRFTVIVIAVAIVAIVAVVVSNGIDLPGGGDDDDANQAADTSPSATATAENDDGGDSERERPDGEDRPAKVDLPENPDDVRGTDAFALTRTRNFRRGLAVLDKERRKVEGAFESLRVAPGRIDTIIVHPDDRMTNIQVRPDFTISFESTHDFPTRPDFRRNGLSGREVDVTAPARLLRQINRVRRGSAERDVDYVVIMRDIIDGTVDVSGYMRVRTTRPRAFLKERGAPLRAIG